MGKNGEISKVNEEMRSQFPHLSVSLENQQKSQSKVKFSSELFVKVNSVKFQMK